jgi:hypothetical protein
MKFAISIQFRPSIVGSLSIFRHAVKPAGTVTKEMSPGDDTDDAPSRVYVNEKAMQLGQKLDLCQITGLMRTAQQEPFRILPCYTVAVNARLHYETALQQLWSVTFSGKIPSWKELEFLDLSCVNSLYWTRKCLAT